MMKVRVLMASVVVLLTVSGGNVLMAGMIPSFPGVENLSERRVSVAGDEESFLIPDPVFRQFCIEYGYADNRGYIIPAAAAKVTWLNLGRKSVTSLEGIRYFTGLEKLTCYYTRLASLDVSGCGKLKELYCNHNPSLVSLNVKGCTSLEKLYCYNTSLTSLDVSGCKALVCLRCHDNASLSKLNVRGCPAMTELYCHDNRLAGLDLTGCTALRTLYCYGNRIAGLDARGMASVKGFRLFCGNQSSDGRVGQELNLILTARQKVRWDDKLADNGSNTRINVTINNTKYNRRGMERRNK